MLTIPMVAPRLARMRDIIAKEAVADSELAPEPVGIPRTDGESA